MAVTVQPETVSLGDDFVAATERALASGKPGQVSDADLEREIRADRKFSLAEAIGRMAGPGAMKGVSPVTRMQQAAVEAENWLRQHLSAGDGELQVVLLRRIRGSELLLQGAEHPLSLALVL